MRINKGGVQAIRRHVEQASDRLDDLARRAAFAGTTDPLLLAESLITLSSTVEELRVSEEELHRQHHNLAASRELIEMERLRYQELFNDAPDAYLITNPDGVIREANRAAAVLLGVPASTLLGKPLVVFVPEEDRRGFRTQLPWLFETERLDGWEIRLVPRRKSPIPVEITVAPVRDAAGRGTGLRWLIRDISFRKRDEALLAAEPPQPVPVVPPRSRPAQGGDPNRRVARGLL